MELEAHYLFTNVSQKEAEEILAHDRGKHQFEWISVYEEFKKSVSTLSFLVRLTSAGSLIISHHSCISENDQFTHFMVPCELNNGVITFHRKMNDKSIVIYDNLLGLLHDYFADQEYRIYQSVVPTLKKNTDYTRTVHVKASKTEKYKCRSFQCDIHISQNNKIIFR